MRSPFARFAVRHWMILTTAFFAAPRRYALRRAMRRLRLGGSGAFLRVTKSLLRPSSR